MTDYTTNFNLEISIHALRKESDRQDPHVHHRTLISIHALRKESDIGCLRQPATRFISIHALRKESDSYYVVATIAVRYFNPRSP